MNPSLDPAGSILAKLLRDLGPPTDRSGASQVSPDRPMRSDTITMTASTASAIAATAGPHESGFLTRQTLIEVRVSTKVSLDVKRAAY